MGNFHIMQIVDGTANLLHPLGNLHLRQPSFGLMLFQVVEEGASFHVLHQQVNVGGVVEEPVELHDVGVLEEGLQLHLPDQLVLQVVFLYDVLWDLFQSVQCFGLQVPAWVHLAEFAVALAWADLEVPNRQSFWQKVGSERFQQLGFRAGFTDETAPHEL